MKPYPTAIRKRSVHKGFFRKAALKVVKGIKGLHMELSSRSSLGGNLALMRQAFTPHGHSSRLFKFTIAQNRNIS
jgi:hypothetical protein